MAEYSSFSYSKLTMLQVQGARDRSNRHVESSRVAGKLEMVESKWKRRLSRSSEYTDESKELFLQAVTSVFSDRSISPFLLDRLVRVCRAEYRAGRVWEHALEQVRKDCHCSIAWWKERLVEEEKSTVHSIQDLQMKIRECQRDMERLRLKQKIVDLQNSIWRLKREESERAGETKRNDSPTAHDGLSKLASQEPATEECTSGRTAAQPISPSLTADDWIDVDDEYFTVGNGGSSEWVLCS